MKKPDQINAPAYFARVKQAARATEAEQRRQFEMDHALDWPQFGGTQRTRQVRRGGRAFPAGGLACDP